MSPGMRVRIRPEAVAFYRKNDSSLEGVVVGISRSGQIARVHLDDLADSYVRTDDLVAIQR